MKYLVPCSLLLTSFFIIMQSPQLEAEPSQSPLVTLITNKGEIQLALYPKEAPVTVKNFLLYAKKGSYNNTIFHRVIKGFVIQGGGYTSNFTAKDTYPPIINEADNNLSNVRGSIAMARTQNPNSATNQFYINLVNNSSALDPKPTVKGYTVFGKVIKGMDVIDTISKVPTATISGHQSVPRTAVVIEKVTITYPSPEAIKKTPDLFSPKKIMKLSQIRSYSPINPYTKDINQSPDSWREAWKLKMYTWLKPFFPGYSPDTYPAQE